MAQLEPAVGGDGYSFWTNLFVKFADSTEAYVGEFGTQVARPKSKHPHDYDGFVIWQSKSYGEVISPGFVDSITGACELWGWDTAKFEKCLLRYVAPSDVADPIYWAKVAPARLERVLQDYLDMPELQLVRLMEFCNLASGRPSWRIYVRHLKLE